MKVIIGLQFPNLACTARPPTRELW